MRAAKSRRVRGARGRGFSKMAAGVLLLAGLLASGTASAESNPWRDWDGWAETRFTPLQLSVIGGPTQIFKKKVPVRGLRLSGLYSNQSAVRGLDLGAFNRTDELTGLGVGLANVAEGDVTGLQLGWAQFARDDLQGVQLGISNVVEGETLGAQLGVANIMENGKGLQVGVWNVAEEMKGLQIGLININDKGFLPIFPFFNFGY